MENNVYENRLKWVYLIGFFLILALPLLNLPPWFSPPDWGKTIVLKIVLSILIFLFIYQILFQKDFFSIIQRKIPRGSALLAFWLLIALLGVFFLATLLSQEPYFSFWGSPHRSGGFLNFAFYIAFALLSFFILKNKDWKKIWDFSIVIGILVSLIGISQLYGLFKNVLIYSFGRPPSTIGGPIFLAIYLLLLSFLTLSFGIKEKKWLKRIFYFSSLLLFLFTALIVTQTRSAFIGFFIGFLYFFLFYPTPKIKLEENGSHSIRRRTVLPQTLAKIVIGLILISGVYSVYYVNTVPELPQFIQENKLLKSAVSRLSIENALNDARISGWKVGWQAFKDKSIIGYGPENFSIGFDKYYDPTLPKINEAWGFWWDRAHNILLDTGTSAGILGLIIYLSLFLVLFSGLQKLKHNANTTNKNTNATNDSSNVVVYHGIQATFLAYLAANFFSFDTFSTYLISFLLIGYSLHLINYNPNAPNLYPNATNKIQKNNNLRKSVFLSVLFCVLIWFIWACNIKPFQINTQINVAVYQANNNACTEAIKRMENILPSSTFLDAYLRLKYINVIGDCIEKDPKSARMMLATKASEILKENIEIRATYTRNWLLLGIYTNYLIESSLTPAEDKEKLKQEADYYFERANQLSPKRQEILIEWIKTDIFRENFQEAKEKSQRCIEINPEFNSCYWMAALANIYLGEQEQAEKNIEIATKKHYGINSELSLLQLTNAYIYTKNYSELIPLYQRLIKIKPDNFWHYRSLAVCYKETGDFKNAEKYALKVLELAPETKESVDEFLKSLK